MELTDLPTPFPAIDLSVAEANVAALQRHCDALGIANRPHVKTHKLPLLAHRQLDAGAVGLTVQTLGEAEVMAQCGVPDLLLTMNPLGDAAERRLRRLTHLTHLSVALDGALALDTVIRASAGARTPLGVLIEFESGGGRQGVTTPEAALALASTALRAGLTFRGLLTYPCGPHTAAFIAAAHTAFAAEGIPIEVVSVGGTPTMRAVGGVVGVTELRVGTAIYHDRRTMLAGVATLDDCALMVHTTLVSLPNPDRGVIDAGSKALTSDAGPMPGYGLIVDYPDAVITRLNEEHGVVDFTACRARPSVGERLRVVPNHACPVSNLFDRVALHRGGTLIAEAIVAARGAH